MLALQTNHPQHKTDRNPSWLFATARQSLAPRPGTCGPQYPPSLRFVCVCCYIRCLDPKRRLQSHHRADLTGPPTSCCQTAFPNLPYCTRAISESQVCPSTKSSTREAEIRERQVLTRFLSMCRWGSSLEDLLRERTVRLAIAIGTPMVCSP